MFERVLFPTDGSETAASVFEFAEAIATEHGAELHVLNVADTSRDSVTRVGGEVVDALETEGERAVDELTERASAGTALQTTVIQGEPKRTIVDYSDRIDADLVVMPTHGRSGLERVLLGSVTEHVINNASVPVLAVNPSEDGLPSYPPTDVLVPTDGSEGADRALASGIDLAAAIGATLHVLTVVETASLGFDARSKVKDADLEATGNEIIADATERAEASVDDVTTSVRHGRPYREIRSYVDDNGIDLVTMGTHGRTDFSRYVLGSVANKLVRSSPVPVLTVRGETDDTE
ncbi:universal stress protein [Halorientalis salina]|uniref:universal stress protein n=1 Tax=Halorientalis salina TaxID=2932266 RepID=UPI0010AC3B94|nr:universal stress protein [Halorientalis salina]